MKKICFIVQRYGLEVNGGAELHCRQLAEHLTRDYDVTVLTTKATDYISWKDVYKSDEELINGVSVKRFPVEYSRDIEAFRKINRSYAEGKIVTKSQELEWLYAQGPVVPGVIEYLSLHSEEYDTFIFFTYLYYPTVLGLPYVHDKAILIPTAHNEPCIEMSIYQEVFKLPRAIFYNTLEERYLVQFCFGNYNIRDDIGGVGIELFTGVEPEKFKEKYGLEDYIIYVGRVSEGKGCDELIHFWNLYKKNNPNESTKLVLLGKDDMRVKENEHIRFLGFVNDEDKMNGIAGARCLVLPSRYESLSIVVLEALSLKVPVVVHGSCPVLTGHCHRSNAGLYYNGFNEFAGVMNYLFTHEEVRKRLGEFGKQYVEENYRWPMIVRKLKQLIEYVSERRA
ncbi:glycosyltransferase family 4 protein [Hungatella effluvii]|uniref:glycosyltransferase family 4 protein n=1 Tax=Hungatella effluvii TaxID=1096246 RepID=UPI0022E6E283|nr:glycosyltransferase family 4 protein [Hungatella effluvii]